MPSEIQFRVIAGSYEHSLLCLSVRIPIGKGKDSIIERQPHFQPIFHFQAHALSIRSMDVAKRYLVTGSNDEHIRIYDLQKRKEIGTLLQHQGSITKLLFSNEIENQPEESKDKEKNDESLRFPTHKSGRWLLSASDDGTILIWRSKDWEKFGVLKGHRGPVYDVAIHPSGRVAVSVGADSTVRLWNLMTAKKASALKLKGAMTRGQEATAIRFDAEGDRFIVAFRDRIMFWNTREAKLENMLGTNRNTIMDVQFMTLGDGNEYMAIAYGDGSVQFHEFKEDLWKLKEGKEVKDIDGGDLDMLPEPKWKLQGHSSRVKGISIYKEVIDGEEFVYMVTISSDGKIVVWDLRVEVMDQVAVYSTGERLNVVSTIQESVEKASTMKPIYNPDDASKDVATDSEYESDGESLAHIMKGGKRKSKKKQRQAKKKLLEVEVE